MSDLNLPFVERSAESDWTIQSQLSEVAGPRNHFHLSPRCVTETLAGLLKVGVWTRCASVSSRGKAETLLRELTEQGGPARALAAIKSPAGLDITAISLDEIAL